MDDDSKQILLLKLGVGFLVFIAILIVIAIIVSIKNANKKQEGLETTTRRTLSGEVIEDTTSTSWFNEETTTSSETTTSTTTTTVAPTTQTTTTTKKRSGGGTTTTKRSSGGGNSSSGGGESEVPSYSYTIINSSDATSYNKADNSMEWAIVNKINQNTNNKYKVALELRTAAERIAQTCCEAPGSCKAATDKLVYDEYKLTYRAFLDETGNYNVNYLYNNLVNDKLLKGNYKYIGVGAIRANSSISCVAWIVDGD